MKFPSLTEIVLSGALIIGVSSVGNSVEIKHNSWSTEEMCYPGADYRVHNYNIKVQHRDNLTKIAQKIESLSNKEVYWKDIYNKNKKKIKNPDLIYPGQEFKFSYSERNPNGSYSTF